MLSKEYTQEEYSCFMVRMTFTRKIVESPGSLYSNHSSRIRFLRFFDNPKTRLFTFFEVMSKNVKNVESISKFSLFLHFETANKHFHCKTITHMSCYTYNIILKLFIFGCNTMALLLCERQQN